MSPASSNADFRILLVEDNPGDARLIQALLEESSQRSFCLKNVDRLCDASETLSQEPFDVVLLDLGLPDSVGLTAVERIRGDFPEIPLIVLTGATDETLGREAVKQGAQDYYRKGEIEGGTLAKALEFAVERQRLLNDLAERTAAVHEGEQRFRSFAEASPTAICVKDLNGRYVYANKEHFRRVGVPFADLVGRTAMECLINEIAIEIDSQDREVIESASARTYESERRLGSEGVIYEISTKFPLFDAEGKVSGIGVVSTDITEQKKGERALQRTVRALQTLSACNEALVRVGSEQQLVADICRIIVEKGEYPSVAILFGQEPDCERIAIAAEAGSASGLTAKLFDSLRLSDDACPIATALQTRKSVVVDTPPAKTEFVTCAEMIAEAGYQSFAILPLLAEGDPFGALVIYSDAVGRFNRSEVRLLVELTGDLAYGVINRRNEERRRIAEAESRKLRRAVDQGSNIVLITDASGTIEYVNPKFTDVTGYSIAEAVGQNPRILKSGEMATGEYANMWRDILSGKEWQGTFHNRRKDGSLYWGESTIAPVRDDSGKITHFIGIQQDITEKRETEQRLRQAEKMESLGNLAGGIAHDFNNMLLPIQNLTSMAMRGLDDDDRRKKLLEKVVEASMRARDLVARILTFSRTNEAERAPESISEVVREATELLRATVPKTIDLRVRIDANTGFVEVDRAQIQTVILNLASNAADAICGKIGHIDVELGPRTFAHEILNDQRTLVAGDYAVLTIRDDGPGIPEDHLDRIFEPFFTTKEVGQGTGLGLAMVHGIILEHGGDISVNSRMGEGTEFLIRLPLLPSAQEEAAL